MESGAGPEATGLLNLKLTVAHRRVNQILGAGGFTDGRLCVIASELTIVFEIAQNYPPDIPARMRSRRTMKSRRR